MIIAGERNDLLLAQGDEDELKQEVAAVDEDEEDEGNDDEAARVLRNTRIDFGEVLL